MFGQKARRCFAQNDECSFEPKKKEEWSNYINQLIELPGCDKIKMQ